MPEMIQIPLEWHVPDDMTARYSTNLVVQRLEHEFLLSFFEVHPPVIVGGPAEIAAKLNEIKSIRATCVSRIIIAAEKLPEVIRALQDVSKKQEYDKEE